MIPFCFGMLAITTVSAQETAKQAPAKSKHQVHQKIAKELNLSAEQKEKMQEIHKESKQKMKALKSDDKITMGEFKKEAKTIRDNRNEKVAATLTPDQQAKLKELKAKREKHKKVVS